MFIQRCRDQLHIVLAMSPIGDTFRNRLRKFPSLVNCCTIDWFQVRHACLNGRFSCNSREEIAWYLLNFYFSPLTLPRISKETLGTFTPATFAIPRMVQNRLLQVWFPVSWRTLQCCDRDRKPPVWLKSTNAKLQKYECAYNPHYKLSLEALSWLLNPISATDVTWSVWLTCL